MKKRLRSRSGSSRSIQKQRPLQLLSNNSSRSSNSNNSRRRSTRGETATIKLQICSDQLGEKNESALPSRRISGAITDSRPRPLVLHAQRKRRRGRKNCRDDQAGRHARAPASDRYVKRAELPKSTRGSPCNHGDGGYRPQ